MASSGILRDKTDKDDRVGIKLLSSEKNVQTIQKMKPVPYLGFKQTMAMFFICCSSSTCFSVAFKQCDQMLE